MTTPFGLFGAGALLLYRDPSTRDLHALFQRRSALEHEPGSWCTYGGMSDPHETWDGTMLREVREEAGLDVSTYPRIYVHRYDEPGSSFVYHTYAVILDGMLQPTHSPETEEARWVRLGTSIATLWENVPQPIHSGMRALVESRAVAEIIGLLR